MSVNVNQGIRMHSRPLSMSGIRKRLPFASGDLTEDDGHVLDDQEQDELIKDLRRRNIQQMHDYTIGLRFLVGLSYILHAISLFSSYPTPLHALLTSAQTPLPRPLPLFPFFTLNSILIHLTLFVHLTPSMNLISPTRTLSFLPMPFSVFIPQILYRPHKILAIASLPPILLALVCKLAGRSDWTSLGWWCNPLVLVGIVKVVEGWIGDAEEDVKRLERMKYNYRGA
ncbi:hypothetical protein GLOTRDRAFT_111256 [Gloeophyllum trabeum ATCC 11539]|uniref:Uncharacterized protein n=1 Tax=Gloeophyllum trabeum (strain ATCC 11539 / FP-39264 / Madison 617) TaxID=670483 RepID=S7RJB0_GLOTA|nr:uncharacterized protein GLOTRDRAFT_111256 [Gloeophyllum trabeum ATCC 11539]EPQ54425.1 hypothetical protein GLOTRDRAFT_111256 [Gloeophyllum trabeum ATCC 11539]